MFVSTRFNSLSARCLATNGLTEPQGGQNWTTIDPPRGSNLHPKHSAGCCTLCAVIDLKAENSRSGGHNGAPASLRRRTFKQARKLEPTRSRPNEEFGRPIVR